MHERQIYRLRAPASGREAFVEADPTASTVDRETGEELKPVTRVLPLAPSPSALLRSPREPRECRRCPQLIGIDVSDCPHCGLRQEATDGDVLMAARAPLRVALRLGTRRGGHRRGRLRRRRRGVDEHRHGADDHRSDHVEHHVDDPDRADDHVDEPDDHHDRSDHHDAPALRRPDEAGRRQQRRPRATRTRPRAPSISSARTTPAPAADRRPGRPRYFLPPPLGTK